MRYSLLLATLAASVATPAQAQTAPAEAQPGGLARLTTVPTGRPATGVTNPPTLARPGLNQGLTQNPVDVGRLQLGGAGSVSNGGATAKAPGGGQIIEEDAPKSRSTVTRDGIEKLPPAANPYQIIELAPGANVSSTDALGLNGGNITVRGFNSDQIGVTIEGAPVNDSGSYSIFPQEYVDAPNIGQVSLAQGTPDLDSPHIGATGGVLNIYQRDPSKTFGAYASQLLGSHGATQSFGRIDTGQIGNFRGFLSYSHYERNHWTGVGRDNRNHVDAKGVYDIDAQNKVSLSVIFNTAENQFYFNPTKTQFGQGIRNYGSVFPSTIITGPNQTANSATNFYKYRTNPFTNLIVSAPSTFTPYENLTYDVIPYFWYGYGSGGGVAGLANGNAAYGNTRLTDSFNANRGITTTLFYNPSITETYRPGIINKLTYQLGDHKLIAGYWFEYADHKQTAPYIPLAANGAIQDFFGGNESGYRVQQGIYAGRILQRRDTQTTTTTNVIFVGDVWNITDRLDFEIGLKQAFIRREVKNYLPGANNYTLNDDATLPTAGVRFKINNENQIFASVGTTFRTPANFNLFDQFNLNTGALTQRGTTNQKAEDAVTIDFGHRYQGDIFVTSATGFATFYNNRQVQTSVPDGGGFITTSINAGSVTTYGFDGEIGTKPIWGGWSAYLSGELLETRLEDNLRVGADFLPTKGKKLPRAPSYQGGLRIAYDDTHFYASISAKYIGEQYGSFLNDEKIGAFGRLDAVVGYRFNDFNGIKKPELKLNLYNLTDERRLVGVNGVTTNAFAARGINGTNIAGSLPTYYQGEGFAAFVTFSGAL